MCKIHFKLNKWSLKHFLFLPTFVLFVTLFFPLLHQFTSFIPTSFYFQYCLCLLSFLFLSVLWLSFHPHFLLDGQCAGFVCVCGRGLGCTLYFRLCVHPFAVSCSEREASFISSLCMPMHLIHSLNPVKCGEELKDGMDE